MKRMMVSLSGRSRRRGGIGGGGALGASFGLGRLGLGLDQFDRLRRRYGGQLLDDHGPRRGTGQRGPRYTTPTTSPLTVSTSSAIDPAKLAVAGSMLDAVLVAVGSAPFPGTEIAVEARVCAGETTYSPTSGPSPVITVPPATPSPARASPILNSPPVSPPTFSTRRPR